MALEGLRAVSDPKSWRRWIGREQIVADAMDPVRAQALHATLEPPSAPPTTGDPLPPLWHWIYFWPIAPASALGPDGHQAKGRFLPPIDLPRRMWAGSRFTFHRDLTVGTPAERRSSVADIVLKEGRSGPLAFVTVRHRVSDAEGLCLEEEQDLVFRGASKPGDDRVSAKAAPSDKPAWSHRLVADPVLLFRYSALTFNGHRIHYDADYAREEEGYPDLIVHGPLLGLLMCQHAVAEAGARPPAGYRFRLSRPIFARRGFVVAGSPLDDGREVQVWVQNEDGALAAEGRVIFA
jgi:3-methylfumaryl-CoA hydratase